MIKRISITVIGRVQGVGFRYFVEKNASAFGLVGFVKNKDNNKVEIIAQGENQKLIELLEKCKKGPGFSRVENVFFDFDEPTGDYKTFKII